MDEDNTIILFDIDGILVRIGSALQDLHYKAFIDGFKRIYDVEVEKEELMQYSGRTDMFIIKDVLTKRGLRASSVSGRINDMFESMSESFSKDVQNENYKSSMITDAADTLAQLSKNTGLILGLLTGNVEAIAQAKMKALGLAHYFVVGGFGDSTDDRAALVGIAISDATKKGLIKTTDMPRVLVVGDTEHDINCAKKNGAVSVAVASGTRSKTELKSHKPDYLLDRLSELPSIISGRTKSKA